MMQQVGFETWSGLAAGATVADVMTAGVHTCRPGDMLDGPARLMWDHACGAIPIVDERGHAVGMVTDRDICMAAYLQGKPIAQIPVTVAGSHRLFSIRPEASLVAACDLMRIHRVRRLAVVDVGGNLIGLLSLADIVRRAHLRLDEGSDLERVAGILAEVFRPSGLPPPAP